MTSVSSGNYSTADPYVGRAAPWSQEAEQAVLGAMLLDQDAALRAAELVDDSMFYREGHRRLFRAMLALTEQRVVIDHITLRDELLRRGELESAGGLEYLAELVDAVPTAANIEFHAKIVKEKAILRWLIEASTSVITETYEGRATANELLDSAEAKIFRISQQHGQQYFVRIKQLLWPAMERVEELHRSGKKVTGVPSGFNDLDEMTSGFQSSELIILAARPSMGKTALALNIAAHVAQQPIGVGIFSLEMSKETLVERMLCAEALVDASKIRTGRLADRDFAHISRAAGFLNSAHLWIDDSPSLSLLEMRSKARRLMLDNDIRLIVVDYLQLMKTHERTESRVQEISEISRSLKALARELKIPIIALSQLSRAAEQRGGDRRPMLSDLRDSGAIEQDADVVLFIHRPWMYLSPEEKSEKPDLERRAEIIVGKQRNGPTGSVNLVFHPQFTRFDDTSSRESPE